MPDPKEPPEPGELGAKSMLQSWGRRYIQYWKAEEPKLYAALVKKGVLYRHALRCQLAAVDEFANRVEAGWNVADARIESFAELLENPLNPEESENLNPEETDDLPPQSQDPTGSG